MWHISLYNRKRKNMLLWVSTDNFSNTGKLFTVLDVGFRNSRSLFCFAFYLKSTFLSLATNTVEPLEGWTWWFSRSLLSEKFLCISQKAYESFVDKQKWCSPKLLVQPATVGQLHRCFPWKQTYCCTQLREFICTTHFIILTIKMMCFERSKFN